jgi:hypothetical protein
MNRRSFIKSAGAVVVLGATGVSVTSALPVVSRSGNIHTVSVSCDGQNWFTEQITQDDLDSAQLDPQTGMRELTLKMEVPNSTTPYKFAKTSGQLVGIISAQYHEQPDIACMMVVAIIIIVVAGVIIYQLVKLCQNVLPDKKNDDKS